MGQSIAKNYLHITFSTKHRQPLIDEHIEAELHSYIGGICKNMDCQPISVGGYTDHIHVLCLLSKKVTLVKLMEEIKRSSSKWIKAKGDRYNAFYWQDGYGAFSVNPSELDAVINYIANQKEHHKTKTFQEEYRAFLAKYKIEFDERYVGVNITPLQGLIQIIPLHRALPCAIRSRPVGPEYKIAIEEAGWLDINLHDEQPIKYR